MLQFVVQVLCTTSYILLYDLLLLVADNAGVIVNNKGEMKGKIRLFPCC